MFESIISTLKQNKTLLIVVIVIIEAAILLTRKGSQPSPVQVSQP